MGDALPVSVFTKASSEGGAQEMHNDAWMEPRGSGRMKCSGCYVGECRFEIEIEEIRSKRGAFKWADK